MADLDTSGYQFFCPLTALSTNVDGALSNFPVVITEDTLPAAFWDTVQSDLGDVRFTENDDGTDLLNLEIEIFDFGGETCALHVRIPSMPSSGDKIIYVWYGNTGKSQPAASAAGGSEGVWDADYDGVYHLGETSGNLLDSTSKGNTITVNGTLPNEVGGVIGDAQDFNGSSDYGSRASLIDTQTYTVECWVNIDSFADSGGEHQRIFLNRRSGSDQFQLLLAPTNTTIGLATNTFGSQRTVSKDGFSINTDYHILASFNQTGVAKKLFIDGVDVSGGSLTTGETTGANDNSFALGRRQGNSDGFFNGTIDEFRVTPDVIRTADWAKASYNFQGFPASNITEGTPVPLISALPTRHYPRGVERGLTRGVI